MTEERPVIPESSAIDTRKSRTTKTILSWTFLLCVLVLSYCFAPSVLSGSSQTGAAEVALVRVLLFWLPIGVVVASFTVAVIRHRRRLTRFVRETDEGFAAMARGDLRRAHDIYRAWAERATNSRFAALSRHNLAWAVMRMGDLDAALAIATDNDERQPGALTAIGLFPTSGVDIALYHALLGNTEVAEQWLAKAEQRTTMLKQPSLPSMKAFVRAVLDCRAGRPEDAARLLDEHWAEHEALLTGNLLRPLRVIRAFAITASGPRNAGIADTMIGAVRPAYPGEYDFLGIAWPEMATFLTSHGLSRGRVADAATTT